MMSANISIKVKNKGLLQDEIIGTYDFDLAKIYFMEKHTLEHQWLALVNPESKNINEVTGNLKISVNIMGIGDP
jgi:hypothetical protein